MIDQSSAVSLVEQCELLKLSLWSDLSFTLLVLSLPIIGFAAGALYFGLSE